MIHNKYSFQTIIPTTYHLDYLVSLPEGYKGNPGERWPMILYLHGTAERGTDLNRVLQTGLPWMLEHGKKIPFIVVSPQCPDDTWWSDHIPAIDILLKEMTDRYAVDRRQILVSGVSMGGYGVWHLGTVYPERFAGLVPVGGGGAWFYGFPEKVRYLHNTPVWAFHGENDPIVPARESQILVGELKAVNAPVRLTVLPEAGHDIAAQVYSMPELFDWMKNQKLKA